MISREGRKGREQTHVSVIGRGGIGHALVAPAVQVRGPVGQQLQLRKLKKNTKPA